LGGNEKVGIGCYGGGGIGVVGDVCAGFNTVVHEFFIIIGDIFPGDGIFDIDQEIF
jgi:hypothetical protein